MTISMMINAEINTMQRQKIKKTSYLSVITYNTFWNFISRNVHAV